MLERIATVGTAILFLVMLLGGLIVTIINVLSMTFAGIAIIGIPTEYFLVGLLCVPPIALILIYLGQGLDIIFNTKI